MRADANVSVKPAGQIELGQRTGIKNLNSMRFLGQAIEYERKRHVRMVKSGETIKMQTRLFDPDKKETRSMREKEEAHDYRYFPDPDLPPLVLEQETLDHLAEELPELPFAKMDRYQSEFGLSEYDAALLTEDRRVAAYFENILETQPNAKSAANWVLNSLLGALNDNGLSPEQIFDCPLKPVRIGQLISLIDNKTITGKIAKQLFEAMWHDPKRILKKLSKTKAGKWSGTKALCCKSLQTWFRITPKKSSSI